MNITIGIVLSIAAMLLIQILLYFKTLTNKNKIKHFDIPVSIVIDRNSCIAALNKLLSYNPTIVGYDCEWKANRIRGEPENKISLIQIGHQALIILIRIHLFSDNIPIELISFLQRVDIIKCGVGIYGDVKKLKKDYDLDTFGCVDLNEIYINSDENILQLGLEKFTNKILGENMQYKHGINHDLWEDDYLSNKHIHYASDDAYVAFKIFKKIIKTQYNENDDILEICFGKIDTNLLRKTKKRCALKHPKPNKQNETVIELRSNAPHGMIKLLSLNNNLLSYISIKTGKLFLRKKWVQKLDLCAIQLLFDIHPINAKHDNLHSFVRGLCMNEYECMVCGDGQCVNGEDEKEENEVLIWHSLIPKQHNIFKATDDPYRVLLCKYCDKLATKIKLEFENELSKTLFDDYDERLKLEQLWKMRNMCWELKRAENRYSHTVEQQNTFIQQIVKYCDIEDVEDVLIKEWHFNSELGIDWYFNNKDYNCCVIRECISIICDETERNRRCSYITKRLNESLASVWKKGKIEYAEMWRNNFMNKMAPKYINKECETFEIDIDKTVPIIQEIKKN